MFDIQTQLFEGRDIRFGLIDPDETGKAFTRWNRDSEFMRLLDSNPTSFRSQRGMQKMLERDLENQKSDRQWFTIHTLADDKLLGDINLSVDHWPSREAFVGLGIGERDFWGKGYGTDVMKIILRYAFTEVNLQRVTLNSFEYNPRAIRSYEKAGFRHEGRQRQLLNREGKRWDMLYMGILREEWMSEQEKEK
jgi:RimJ/RimL family protein N-acetyltransferase